MAAARVASVRSAVVPLPDRYKSQQGRSEVKPGKMGDRKGFFFVLSLFYQPDVFNWNKKITVIFQGESVMPVAVIGN